VIPQAAILAPVAVSGRFLVFALRVDADAGDAMKRLASVDLGDAMVLGVGQPLLAALGRSLPGLRPFPVVSGPAATYPSTQGALFAFVAGRDAGETLLSARALRERLGDAFVVEEEVLAFKYADGRDLSGYLDGTENPQAERAVAAALVSGQGPGLDGGSYVAVQRWVHDLAHFASLDAGERDAIIGRRRDTNEEMSDAPASSHVKRTAQESFDPTAFMLRRSMPWGSTSEHGLFFVAYGRTLDAFERMLIRMSGAEDGIADALARFTRPVTGGYYFCPPLRDNRLNLTALGL
jgi:putative iron-dependent peroxidase